MCSYQEIPKAKTKHWLGLVFSAMLLTSTNVFAVAFDSDISITATANLDGFSFSEDPGINLSGDISSSIGGTSSSTGINSSVSVSGSLPQGGVLTDLNDGVGINFSGNSSSAEGTGAAGLYGDYVVDLSNNSAVDTFKVILGWDFTNQVDANGPDVGVIGDLSLSSTVEFFFSRLVSDTLFEDEAYGSDDDPDTDWETSPGYLGTFGESLLDHGLLLFEFILNPGQVVNVTGRNDLDVFLYDGDYSGEASSRLFVSDVVKLPPSPPPVLPEPTSLWLIAVGLAAFRIARRSV